jgi:hypothetical protein
VSCISIGKEEKRGGDIFAVAAHLISAVGDDNVYEKIEAGSIPL